MQELDAKMVKDVSGGVAPFVIVGVAVVSVAAGIGAGYLDTVRKQKNDTVKKTK